MIDILAFLSQRWIVVGLAITGALVVMGASLLAGNRANSPPRHITWLSRLGYAITAASICLFIVAGFLSGR